MIQRVERFAPPLHRVSLAHAEALDQRHVQVDQAGRVQNIASRCAEVISAMEPHTLTAAVTNAIREATGGLPVAHIRSMDEIVVLTTSRQIAQAMERVLAC